MAQSLCMVYLHLVFHVKNTSVRIKEEDLNAVHAHIANLLKTRSDNPFWVDGIEDHVHVVCSLGRQETISDLVGFLKRASSKWIKHISPYYSNFEWQGGYGIFSIGKSQIPHTIEYLKNQRVHHKIVSFKEEYIGFLKFHGISFEESYVLSD
ncbi:MAG: transposase [Bacteroidales bacterium]|nr:transposase [Bacteroidales bacterium]